jgi:hypothetical protein
MNAKISCAAGWVSGMPTCPTFFEGIGEAALCIFQRLPPARGIHHVEFVEQARNGICTGFL